MEHDASYKDLFSHPEMVADLLTGFVAELWVQEVDFATLEKVSGSYVSDDLRTREDDPSTGPSTDSGRSSGQAWCGGCGCATVGCTFTCSWSSSPASTHSWRCGC